MKRSYHHYVLDAAGEPQLCDDMAVWTAWWGTTDRKIAEDTHNDITVSTVFLGLDHNYGSKGPPSLFETMIFGGEHDGDCQRTPTREDALKMHDMACYLALPPKEVVDPAAEYEDAMAGKEILEGLK